MCGKCFYLTLKSKCSTKDDDCDDTNHKAAGKSFYVKVNDLCPAAHNEACLTKSEYRERKRNHEFRYKYHFDISIPGGGLG